MITVATTFNQLCGQLAWTLIFTLPALAIYWLLWIEEKHESKKKQRGFEVEQKQSDR